MRRRWLNTSRGILPPAGILIKSSKRVPPSPRKDKVLMDPVLQLENVSRSFKKGREIIPVLQNVNVNVNPLEFLCLVGESGCGKHTTGNILSGLLKPYIEQLLFVGEEV